MATLQHIMTSAAVAKALHHLRATITASISPQPDGAKLSIALIVKTDAELAINFEGCNCAACTHMMAAAFTDALQSDDVEQADVGGRNFH